MTSRANWSWRLWPFDRCDRALERVAMKLAADTAFDSARTTFVLDPTVDGSPCDVPLELQLDTDPHLIETDCGIERGRSDLAVVLQDHLARTSELRARWPLERVPRHWRTTLADCCGGRVKLKVVVALNRSRARPAESRSIAFRQGSILAEKVFSLTVPTSRSLFPVENTSFSQHGWDSNALWYVEWRDLEAAHIQSPESTVTVHVNKDLPAFQELWRPAATRSGSLQRTTANMVRELVAAGIMAEICHAALASLASLGRAKVADATLLPEPESLTGRLVNLLRGNTSITNDDLTRWATTDPGRFSRRVQGLLESGAKFDIDALNALRGQE